MFTVVPHTMPHGVECGRWHCIVLSTSGASGSVCVAEIVQDPTAQPKRGLSGPPAPAGWRRRMMTSILVSKLVPLEVDVDLFGSPIGGRR